LKILFVFPYPIGQAASQRFRFEQYLNLLDSENIEYYLSPYLDTKSWSNFYKKGFFIQKAIGLIRGMFRRILSLAQLHKYDYVFIHRESSPVGPPIYEYLVAKVFGKKIIFDFDDAIWLSNSSESNRFFAPLKWHSNVFSICNWSYKVSVGNEYLRNTALIHNKQVFINPTTIDTENLHNQIKDHHDETKVIGWKGSHSTIKYLEPIFPILKKLKEKYNFKFIVISDEPPEFNHDEFEFIKWNKENEISDLLRINIGIMPLTKDPWSEGKCGFKALQYMSLGVPALVSPVGVNETIVDHGINGFVCKTDQDWVHCLSKLLEHIKLNAKMVPFAGYNMPLQYTGLTDEHTTVRNNVGVFDVSHMGEFIVEGEGALEFLQYVTSNDVSKLFNGKVQYTCLPNGNNGIVDDLLIYQLSENKYMLVVNASNIEKDWDWFQKYRPENVEMTDISNNMSLLAVQGPKALDVMKNITGLNLEEMKYYTFLEGEIAGVKDVIISTTGYTGSGGFEVYVKNDHAEQLWDAVFNAGQEMGIKPAGLAARDTLRLEMGFCLYGNDIDDNTSPIEAGLGWVTKFSKEFLGSDMLKKQKEDGVSRKLVGFELTERGIPRQGYVIKNQTGDEIGKVTSGTMAPSLQKAIGLGYVKNEYSSVDSAIYIEIRNKQIPAIVVTLPFK
jgi:aminomethyltransferase